MKGYQRDALGQIERLADCLNDLDAAPEGGDDTLPADVAIELLCMYSDLTVTLTTQRNDERTRAVAAEARADLERRAGEIAVRSRDDEADKRRAAEAKCDRLAKALREQLEAERLWVTDATAAFEKEAEAFYRETGYIAPGKDVPGEMNPSDDYMRERQAEWRAWNDGKRKARHKRWQALLADTPEPEQKL